SWGSVRRTSTRIRVARGASLRVTRDFDDAARRRGSMISGSFFLHAPSVSAAKIRTARPFDERARTRFEEDAGPLTNRLARKIRGSVMEEDPPGKQNGCEGSCALSAFGAPP